MQGTYAGGRGRHRLRWQRWVAPCSSKGPWTSLQIATGSGSTGPGDPAMSVGGTGDVLAGACGALLCHLPAFEAACIAAYAIGRAGERVAEERGEGMLASDLVDRIPKELFRRQK